MATPLSIDELPPVTSLSSAAAVAIVQGGTTYRTTPAAFINVAELFSHPGTGALNRTTLAKIREIEISVNDFSTVQQVIDAFKNASESTPFTTTVVIRVPDGDHEITAPISLYSGVKLRGTGEASKIVQGSGFSGTALVLLKGQGANASCESTGTLEMGFECTGSTWAIKADATNVLNSEFKKVYLDAGFGMDFGTYTQNCVVDKVYAGGSSTNQILHLKGNHNFIRNIDKEGSTGSSTDSYILVEGHSGGDSTGNVFDGVLLEGGTSANKSLMKLSDCDTTILDNLWFEPTSTDGYALRIVDCNSTRIRNIQQGLGSTTKLKVDTSENTIVDVLDVSGAEQAPSDVIEIDATSDVHVRVLKTRRGAEQYVLSDMDRNLVIDSAYMKQIFTDLSTTYSPIAQARWLAGQNLAVNGSFEAGNYGWTFSTSPTTTEEYITSEVGAGLMGHFVYAAAATHNHYQSITVPANMPVTITAKVKCEAGASSFITIFAENLGITSSNSYTRAGVGKGWQIITRTIIPTSAGALLVGFQYVNATEVYVDEFSVSVGTVGVPNQGKFGTLDVGGKTIAFGSGASPATGTWKQGDVWFRTDVSAGGSPGAHCVTGGSPGTWKAMAAVAA